MRHHTWILALSTAVSIMNLWLEIAEMRRNNRD